MKKILLLLAVAPMAAEGAKMCRAGGDTFSYQRGGNYLWARGTGCAGTTWDDGSSVGTGFNLAQVVATCGTPLLAGTSSCWTSDSDKPSGAGYLSGPHCWCKLLYPVESDWVFYRTGSTAENCQGSQVNDCTLHCATIGYRKLLAF